MSSSSSSKISPVRQQYLDIKAKHQDAILFFRLGDFYETFDEDAELVARALDIVLTSRNVAKGVRVPMAGIPHHAMENYLSRLIEKGYHAAICEQIGDEPVNGLMPREVVRIVTPGTIVEPGLLPGDRNNYLAALIIDESRAGVAYVDITTGEFGATEISGKDILAAVRAEINRLRPAEILIPDTFTEERNDNGWPGFQTDWPAWRFEPGRCEELLRAHFEVTSLDGFGLRGHPLAIRAAGGILQYLRETQPAALNLLKKLSFYSLNEFMVLDANTRRNLELTETIREGRVKGSLLGILDKTVSPMGSRLMGQWVSRPLLDVDEIVSRQTGVTTFYKDGLGRAEVRSALKPLNDLERLTNRVVGGTAQPRDLVAMRHTLTQLPAVFELLQTHLEILNSVISRLSLCEDELRFLQTALAEDPPATLQNTGIIRAGYSEELDSVLESSEFARKWIAGFLSWIVPLNGCPYNFIRFICPVRTESTISLPVNFNLPRRPFLPAMMAS